MIHFLLYRIGLRYSSFSHFPPNPPSKGMALHSSESKFLKSQPIEVWKLRDEIWLSEGWHCTLVGVTVVWDLALGVVGSKT